MTLTTYTYWSPMLGCEVCRISLGGPKGEYHTTLPTEDGRGWRQKKREAVDALARAVELDLEPGQVKWQ